jgi:protein-S-isoprenylcysteine O-methyltransferase Ste14
MDLYSEKGKSFPQKFLVLVLDAVSIVLSYKFLFPDLFSGFRAADRDIYLNRSTLISSFNLVVFLLWVADYAVVTRYPWAYVIPGYLFLFFSFYNIPKLDAYCAAKYPEEFRECRQKTKRMIPFIL